MKHGGEIAAIIQNHIRFPGRALLENLLFQAPFVLFFCFTFPGKNRCTICCNSCGSVILSGKDIAGCPAHLGSQCLQCLD